MTPKSLEHALDILHNEPGRYRPFAGGTDLMVVQHASKAITEFLNLWPLTELSGISKTADGIRIGSLTTYSQIRADPLAQKYFPLLCLAAKETGAIAIQNRGTIGGNIANASPAADSPPALLVYDAKINLISAGGRRTLDYKDFHLAYKKIDLRNDELIESIDLPLPNSAREFYRKVGPRLAQAISKVCLAARVEIAGDKIVSARIALGGVAPTPVRCFKTESLLNNKTLDPKVAELAANTLATEIAPIDDMRSTATYRTRVATNLLQDFLSAQ